MSKSYTVWGEIYACDGEWVWDDIKTFDNIEDALVCKHSADPLIYRAVEIEEDE